MRLDELAKQVGAEVIGDGNVDVTSANTLEDARSGQISFLANPKYEKHLQTTKASAVIVSGNFAAPNLTLLKTLDPYYAFAQAIVLLHGHRRHPHSGVDPRAHVDPSAVVGAGTVVYPGVYIGPRAKVGRDCILYPNAVIYDDCEIGDRVIVQANAVIGQDGYGFATHRGEHLKIPHIGKVVIEDDVEIGACTTIARASVGSTVIGRGTKIDSQVVVGHGVKVGPHGLLVAQVGIAGSTTMGHHVTVAGQAGVTGHVSIGDNVTIAAQSGVTRDIPDQSTLMGSPAMPIAQARRVYELFTQMPELVERIRSLEQQVAELGAEDRQEK